MHPQPAPVEFHGWSTPSIDLLHQRRHARGDPREPFGAGRPATNYITPQKVLKAVQLVKTGQMYELGHIYESSMPQFGSRPYYIDVPLAGRPRQSLRATSSSLRRDAVANATGWTANAAR